MIITTNPVLGGNIPPFIPRDATLQNPDLEGQDTLSAKIITGDYTEIPIPIQGPYGDTLSVFIDNSQPTARLFSQRLLQFNQILCGIQRNVKEFQDKMNSASHNVKELVEISKKQDEDLRQLEASLTEIEKEDKALAESIARTKQSLRELTGDCEQNAQEIAQNEHMLNQSQQMLNQSEQMLNQSEQMFNQSEQMLKQNEQMVKKNEQMLKQNEQSLVSLDQQNIQLNQLIADSEQRITKLELEAARVLREEQELLSAKSHRVALNNSASISRKQSCSSSSHVAKPAAQQALPQSSKPHKPSASDSLLNFLNECWAFLKRIFLGKWFKKEN